MGNGWHARPLDDRAEQHETLALTQACDVYVGMTDLAMMKWTTVWLSSPQREKLAKLSKTTGLKVAELIRRFIDEG